MADRRRRRKPVTNGGESDDSSDESVNGIINHTLSDLGSDADGANSEYESADEEDLLPPGAEATQVNIDPKLDDDEDRKNPQYIPKKGTFYEHDDRTMPPDDEGGMLRSDIIEADKAPGNFPGAALPVVNISSQLSDSPQDQSAVSAAINKQANKKVWRGDDNNKWSHDKFEEYDQSPKAREELVSVYGYDIRSEEGAPRARRRRRYGRGPNKYTRNWEDLDAYTRPARGVGGILPGRGGRGGGRGRPPLPEHKEDDFPALPGQDADTAQHDGDAVTASPDEAAQQGASPKDSTATPPQQQQHSSQVYTNQEYRRSKYEGSDGPPSRGARGRGGRGAPRGARGRPERGGKQGYTPAPVSGGGGGHTFDSQRGSDDIRVSSNSSRGPAPQPPPPYQQQSPRHDANKNGVASQHPPSAPSQLHPPPPPPPSHTATQRPPSPQEQQGGGPYPRPKRYSTQRSSRPSGPPPSSDRPNNRNGPQDRSNNTGPPLQPPQDGHNNPHYKPHPHHNLHYHDTSTTPPPGGDGPAKQQPVAQGHAAVGGGSGGGVVYNGGGVMYGGGAGEDRPPTTQRPPPPPPHPHTTLSHTTPQFVAPSAFVGAPGVFIPPPGTVHPPAVQYITPGGVLPATAVPPTIVGSVVSIAGAPPPLPPAVTSGPPPRPPPFLPTEGLYNGQPPPPPPAVPSPQQFQTPPPSHPPQYPYAAFQPVQPTEGAQPQEVYRNGVMYYSTQNQQPQRSCVTLQKRPKAAIPILPPPARPGYPHQPDGKQHYQDPDYQQDMAYKGYYHSAEMDAEGHGDCQVGSADGYEGEDATVDPADHYAIQQLQLQQLQPSAVAEIVYAAGDGAGPADSTGDAAAAAATTGNASVDDNITKIDTVNVPVTPPPTDNGYNAPVSSTNNNGNDALVASTNNNNDYIVPDVATNDNGYNSMVQEITDKVDGIRVEDSHSPHSDAVVDEAKFEDSVERLEACHEVAPSTTAAEQLCTTNTDTGSQLSKEVS